ncbi:GntP family permease [Anoxybacillus flavithermus]|uniref:GntP family permease n=1 Tax=Anoxybacillus flavithermus (strain DSM 21510 / WK1) TaxID=491915 RepID=B7GG43_ANOFW|nr:SLC13 family permease [Anoxybacillus flavithermus]ACJ34024.1 GntP family permease [Anoxybacillus flavithermus WK1]
MTVNTFGAMIAFLLAIIFILRNVPVGYGMMCGAFIGALLGGASIDEAVRFMIDGAKEMIPSILRMLAAGVLAGVFMQSGAAVVLAEKLVQACGEKYALFTLCCTAMMLTACGVFVDVAIMTIAPVALAIAHRLELSRFAILLALIGGGKAGNIISPNPNTIAAAEAFHVPLSSLMIAGIAPAVVALFVTYHLAKRWSRDVVHSVQVETVKKETLSWQKAIVAPLVAISLLLLRPLFSIAIDPLIALPAGALVGVVVMNKTNELNMFLRVGMEKMSDVVLMLIGTGTLAGVIANSSLHETFMDTFQSLGLSPYVIAPLAGALLSGMTASTTAGAAVASHVFGKALMEAGVSPLAGAAMVHAGATVLDHLPHGSFFHATAASVHMSPKERLQLLPSETLIGLTIAATSTIVFTLLL